MKKLILLSLILVFGLTLSAKNVKRVQNMPFYKPSKETIKERKMYVKNMRKSKKTYYYTPANRKRK